jgi:hypothetical protein
MGIVAVVQGTICDRLFFPATAYPQRGSATPYAPRVAGFWRLTDQVLEKVAEMSHRRNDNQMQYA